MSKITIHDSTCRDGQHGVRHQLTASQIGRYAKAAEKAGVPVVYVSHGNGLGASSIHLDPSLLPDRQMLLAARKHLNKTKLGCFVLPGFATIYDIEKVLDLVDVIEIGCHCSEVTVTKQYVQYCKSKGKEVYIALMMSHMLDAEELYEQAKLAENYG